MPAPTETPDRPPILLPPPLIPVTMLVVGAGLQQVVPLGWLVQIPPGLRIAAGVAVALVGITILVLGARGLRRHDTNVNPYQPSLAIVTDGIYARTRNPIYVGGIAATVGIAMALALDWVLLLHLLGLPILHYGVVLREERYLQQKFGEAYSAYKAAVGRYV